MKRREYLNDYKQTANGEYVYTGKHYIYSGENGKKLLQKTCVLNLAIAIGVIGSGCINSSGMNNSFYVILPYIAEVACAFILTWNVVRLALQGKEIKEYVYKSVTKNIPNSAKSLILFSSAGIIASIVYFVLNHNKSGFDYSFALPAIKVLTIAVGFLFVKTFSSITFEEK